MFARMRFILLVPGVAAGIWLGWRFLPGLAVFLCGMKVSVVGGESGVLNYWRGGWTDEAVDAPMALV